MLAELLMLGLGSNSCFLSGRFFDLIRLKRISGPEVSLDCHFKFRPARNPQSAFRVSLVNVSSQFGLNLVDSHAGRERR
jgi:hypothetical protein